MILNQYVLNLRMDIFKNLYVFKNKKWSALIGLKSLKKRNEKSAHKKSTRLDAVIGKFTKPLRNRHLSSNYLNN